MTFSSAHSGWLERREPHSERSPKKVCDLCLSASNKIGPKSFRRWSPLVKEVRLKSLRTGIGIKSGLRFIEGVVDDRRGYQCTGLFASSGKPFSSARSRSN